MHLRPDGLPQKLICSVWGLVSTHLSSRVAHKKRSGVWTHVLRHGEDFIFTNTELSFLKRQLWCIYFKIDFIVYNSDTKTGIAEVNRARNVLRCERLYVCSSAWKKTSLRMLFVHWRSRRDLNSRASFPTYTLSRGTSSATWVLLQFWFAYISFAIKVYHSHF